jgi:hypothetical protein
MERFCFTTREGATSHSQIATSMFNSMMIREQLNMVDMTQGLRDATYDLTARLTLKDSINLNKRKPGSHQSLDQVPLKQHLERVLCDNLHLQYRRSEYRIEYFKRCDLASGITIGSLASQYDTLINRRDCYICFRIHNQLYGFGTVLTYIAVAPHRKQYAIIRLWTGVHLHRNRYATFVNKDGALRLVDLTAIVSPVGYITSQLGSRRINLTVGAPQEYLLQSGES